MIQAAARSLRSVLPALSVAPLLAGCGSPSDAPCIRSEEGLALAVSGGVDVDVESLADEVRALIPRPEDWEDYGPVLERGSEGEWDMLWAGVTPVGIVWKDSTYFFYYVAADGYRSHDEGPRHRAIGVATSPDGIHFTKYEGNPILTHTPLQGEEEGANSAGLTLDADGEFVMFYGAATGAGARINADVRLAVSEDGFGFTDVGLVLDHEDPCVFGYGDELFPHAALESGGKWHVYYVPNGSPESGVLSLAVGRDRTSMQSSSPVLRRPPGPVGVWGNVSWLTANVGAVFVQHGRWPDAYVEVRLFSRSAPHRLSEPVARYDIPELKRGTAFLDVERRTWFMYYNDFDPFWSLRLAPAGPPDDTPPTAPGSLSARASGDGAVELYWDPSTDTETGVIAYRVYRDGARVGEVREPRFVERGVSGGAVHTYDVTAINLHGREGPAASTGVAQAGGPAHAEGRGRP